MSKHDNKPTIIFENMDFIVINKPAGLLSIPDRKQSETSLKDLLLDKYEQILTVHRLDKETSGVIVFARNEQTHKQFSDLFENRQVKKYYVGLVHGKLINDHGSIDAAIMEHPVKKGKMITHVKGKPSLTDYEVIENFNLFSWARFCIHTGRTHQIRVHMQHISHSIACDELYGSNKPVFISDIKHNYHLSKDEEAEKPILSRLALHSSQLIFDLNNEHYEFEAEIPKDLKATLQQLRKWNKDH